MFLGRRWQRVRVLGQVWLRASALCLRAGSGTRARLFVFPLLSLDPHVRVLARAACAGKAVAACGCFASGASTRWPREMPACARGFLKRSLTGIWSRLEVFPAHAVRARRRMRVCAWTRAPCPAGLLMHATRHRQTSQQSRLVGRPTGAGCRVVTDIPPSAAHGR